MQKFRISGNFWLTQPADNAYDVLAHMLHLFPKEAEIVESYAQKVSKAIVFSAVVAVLEDETQAKEIGEALANTPCPWAHDGIQVVPLW